MVGIGSAGCSKLGGSLGVMQSWMGACVGLFAGMVETPTDEDALATGQREVATLLVEQVGERQAHSHTVSVGERLTAWLAGSC